MTNRSWPDTALVLALVLTLVPAVWINSVLWLEHLAGLGIYDPGLGGDPAWRGRPLFVPMLVATIALARLALRTLRPIAARQRVGLTIIAVIALLLAAASKIPEPSLFLDAAARQQRYVGQTDSRCQHRLSLLRVQADRRQPRAADTAQSCFCAPPKPVLDAATT